MTEVLATRKYQFRLASKGNVNEIAGQLNKSLSENLNTNICEASAFVDPEDSLTIVVEMRCATGSDIYSVDKAAILKIIKESEKDRIEHDIGQLELQV